MNFDLIQCEGLQQAVHIPNTTDDHSEETWFVKFGEEIVGVGLFPKDGATCVLAIIGDREDNRQIVGNPNDHESITIEGLNIAYEGYLRSILGDVVIGNKQVEE